jgi:proline dehydrogenase
MEKIFDNTENAFTLKSDSELERAYFLFKLINNEPLVKIGTAVTNFALKAHLPVEKLIRASVFDHFCGGVSELDCITVVEKMFKNGVASVLDYSVEGKEEESSFEAAFQKIILILDFVKKYEAIPFAVFKPTGFGRIDLFEKVSKNEILNTNEKIEWERVVFRFDEVCKKAKNLNVSLLIDAEESWMQKAADELVEKMMEKYNKDNVIIFNTLQMYRWDRLDYLKELHEKSQEKNFFMGFKIVRGAYMEKENYRAIEENYPTPICKDKATTDENFDNCLTYILNNLDKISIFIGSHNENSNYLAIETMQKLGLKKNDNRVWFGQLFGMSDHISFNLAKNGFNVAKYLPFGPVRDVMPYLIRRAEENTSVAGQTSRELNLLKSERLRRNTK